MLAFMNKASFACLLLATLSLPAQGMRKGAPNLASSNLTNMLLVAEDIQARAWLETGDDQCREKFVKSVCECKSWSSTIVGGGKVGGYQCSGCKDKKKWGYGCDLDCPSSCIYGCDFSGNCIVPSTCKRNGRVALPTEKHDVLNERGECQACDSGYYGLYCTEKCPVNCKDKYEGKCARDGTCYRCEDGWFGERCDKPCPLGCPKCAFRDGLEPVSDGSTDFLPAGACKTQCQTNHWGNTCEDACPANCKKSRIPSCLKESGHCMKCEGHNFWGTKCESKCEEGCIDNRCAKLNGVCEDGCKTGYYGTKCEKKCNANCLEDGCDEITGKCKSGCKPGFWGSYCSTKCPSGTKPGTACDRETALPEECVPTEFPAFSPTGLGKCFKCPETCKHNICDNDGKCSMGCEEGYWGDACQNICPPKCDGACDAKTTQTWDGYCAACEDGFTGKRCTKRCHKSCKTCAQYGDAVTEDDCLSCHPDRPTELEDGKCVCILGAKTNETTGDCECEEPSDPTKKAFFEIAPVKRCRFICKNGYKEAFAKETSKCFLNAVWKAVMRAEALADGEFKCQQGGCASGECEISMGNDSDEKVCIEEDYVKNILE